MVVGGENLGEQSSDMYLPLFGGAERAAVVPPMHVCSSKLQLGNVAEHYGRLLYVHTTAGIYFAALRHKANAKGASHTRRPLCEMFAS